MGENSGVPFKLGKVDEESYELFIKELLKVLDEGPPGMQGRFAKAIKYLNKKKSIARSSTDASRKINPKMMYEKLCEIIDKELELNDPYGEKFEMLLTISKLRELISHNK
ncbi:MAG: hypothetical protein ACTSWY_03995 [Promethearchaeota archaeon]